MGKGMTVAEIQELVPTLAVTVEPVGRLQEYAGCFKALHQQAGIADVIARMSFAELMTDAAGAF